MSETEVQFEHHLIDEFERGENHKTSGRGELNPGFITAFRANQRDNGHPAVFRDGDNAVDGPVTVSLALRWGEENGQVGTTEVEIGPGDIYTISGPDSELRIKFYGPVYSRPENEAILNDLGVHYSLDEWDSHAGVWREVQRLSATNNGVVEEDLSNSTLRVVLTDAPGLDPEKDFRGLIEEGLSPAEALD